MKNRDLYKGAMSGVRHSDVAIERIYNMTVDKKRSNKGLLLKKIACFALAFSILVVGGEFGVNAIKSNDKANDALTVMVAYASDNGKLSFGSKSEQKLFWGIYNAPLDDEKACKAAEERFNAEKAELIEQSHNISKETGSYSSYASGGYYGYNKKQEKNTAWFYTLQGGWFELNLEDYSDVKCFKVNNESKYGLLLFEYWFLHDVYYKDSDVPPELASKEASGHEFILTGDELRYSQDSGNYAAGFGKYETNKGYFLTWGVSDELVYAIGDNPNFDLSQIKDTITFTVEFNDGTVKTASLNLYFDRDGYMHFE